MSLFRSVLAVFVFCICAIASARGNGDLRSWQSESRFLEAADVFKLEAVEQQDGSISAEGRIARGYYVYRHSLKLVDGQGRDVDLQLPAGKSKHDEFFGDTEIYTGDALRMRFPVASSSPLMLHWQGCAEAGICYPPQTMKVGLPQVSPSAESLAGSLAQERLPAMASLTSGAAFAEAADIADDQVAARQLAELGPASSALLFFGFGLLLAFTPCSLPMIPIVSAVVVGSQAKPRRAILLSLSYVLAMAGTYAAIGVAAGVAGANLQATLQSPWLLGAFAALFLALASSLFGLFELRLPSAVLDRVETAGRGRSGGSLVGAAGLGFLSALLVGPCMTAPLAGALLFIGQTGSALHGGLALLALGLGMGLPLLVITVFGARVLPRPGAWMDRVRVVFGYVMLGMAAMMLARLFPGTGSLALWGAWMLSLAIGLLAWGQAMVTKRRLAWTLRSGAAFAGLWSVLMLVGAASGGASALQPLAHLRGTPAGTTAQAASQTAYVQAKSVAEVDARVAQAASRGQWTLIDFYADWCVSCHVIEREVLRDAAVSARLAGMQVVRPDVTRNDAADQALLKHWGVMGPPTLILVGPDGVERRELRVVGEIDARAFLGRLDAAGVS